MFDDKTSLFRMATFITFLKLKAAVESITFDDVRRFPYRSCDLPGDLFLTG